MILSTSGIVFYHYYWPSKITYEKWQYKTNPKYPTPEKVRDEIVQTAKGIFTATLCPALSMYLAAQGKSKAYCTPNPFVDPEHGGFGHVVLTFFVVVLVSDFWEWGYHRLGHVFSEFWNV